MSQGHDGTLSRKTTAHTSTLSAHRDIAVDTHAHALQQTPNRQRHHRQSVPPPLKTQSTRHKACTCSGKARHGTRHKAINLTT